MALSASVRRAEVEDLSRSLGFSQDSRRCTYIIRPVDHLTITYVTRFFGHATSNRHFLDLSWLVSLGATCTDNIPITVVFTDRIKYSNRLMIYLTNLLPNTITGVARRLLICPYNALMSLESRTQDVSALRAGSVTRILVCTDARAFVIDIPKMTRVVVAVNNPESEFRTLCQKIGQIRCKGVAVVYPPKWMNLARTGAKDVSLPGRADPAMVAYANADSSRCPHQVSCEHWGCSFVSPIEIPCCNLHQPSIDTPHTTEVDLRAAALKKLNTKQNPRGPNATGKHHPLEKKSMQSAVFCILTQWRGSTWL